jgi:hypothetical protein
MAIADMLVTTGDLMAIQILMAMEERAAAKVVVMVLEKDQAKVLVMEVMDLVYQVEAL